jgi:hypothetical protein
MKKNKIFIKYYYAIFIFFAAFTFFNVYAIAQERSAPAADHGKDKQKPWETDLTGWRIKDYQPYIQAIKDLSKLSREYSENALNLAIDEYSSGLDKLEKMESEVAELEEINKNKKNLGEQWYWQEIDRKEQEKRQINKVKLEAKTNSITYFVMAFNHLDEIQLKSILESKELENFKIRLYQVFVSTQYDLQNFFPCIPILERYILLNNETKKDLWAYKYLTNCYAFMEAVSQKSRSMPREKILNYRQLKNKYLMIAMEIQHGTDSPEYKHMQGIVNKEEKKTLRLNDLK